MENIAYLRNDREKIDAEHKGEGVSQNPFGHSRRTFPGRGLFVMHFQFFRVYRDAETCKNL